MSEFGYKVMTILTLCVIAAIGITLIVVYGTDNDETAETAIPHLNIDTLTPNLDQVMAEGELRAECDQSDGDTLLQRFTPDDSEAVLELVGFEFEITYKAEGVCVHLFPGSAAQELTCVVEKGLNNQSEGVSKIRCFDEKGEETSLKEAPMGIQIAVVEVLPKQ